MGRVSSTKIKDNSSSDQQSWKGINPQRKWGQHFLLEDKVLQKELKQAQIKPEETVLEIGPGGGNLTELLLKRARRVIAIEKDLQFKEKLEALQEENPHLQLIWGDARYVKWPPVDQLVANLPFKVALPVTFRFLDHPASKALLVYQASQAQRLCAKAGKKHYGRLSV